MPSPPGTNRDDPRPQPNDGCSMVRAAGELPNGEAVAQGEVTDRQRCQRRIDDRQDDRIKRYRRRDNDNADDQEPLCEARGVVGKKQKTMPPATRGDGRRVGFRGSTTRLPARDEAGRGGRARQNRRSSTSHNGHTKNRHEAGGAVEMNKPAGALEPQAPATALVSSRRWRFRYRS